MYNATNNRYAMKNKMHLIIQACLPVYVWKHKNVADIFHLKNEHNQLDFPYIFTT